MEEPRIAEEILSLKTRLATIEGDIKLLHTKSDHALGSITYISDEYDDFLVQTGKFIRDNQSLTSTICNLNENFDQINKRLSQTEKELEQLAQYGRLENLEIHGVPMTENENTKQIVMKVAEELKVRLTENDISTSHRLFSSTQLQRSQNQNSENQSNAPLPIIVRFSNRDKKK